MLAGLKRKFSGTDRVAGVEFLFLQEGGYRVRLVRLSVKRSIIHVDSKIQFNSLDELVASIDKNIPLSLVFTGKGILTKKVYLENNQDMTSLLSQVFPNAKPADFYIQKKENFLSVARRTQIDEVLDQLRQREIPVISLSIGPMIGLGLIPFLKITDHLMSFDGHQYTLENDVVKEYKYLPQANAQTIRIGEEELGEQYALSYAGALQAMLAHENVCVEDDVMSRQAEEYTYKNLLKQLMTVFSIVLISVIVSNFIFSFYLNAQNQKLSSKQQGYQLMLSRQDSLETQIKEKEKFLKESGWLENSRISFFSDRIASTVPESVRLTELSVNPFHEKESTAAKKLIFQNGITLLSGHCSSATELNPWIKKMKDFDWIREVKVLSYAYNEKNKEGDFKIEITLR
ncbi:MAG: hypothetical protein ACJ75J_17570 [Cytophagaceae bacterium]